MTPPRLTELECPNCQATTWVMDSDYRGIDGVMVPYDQREYRCTSCRHHGQGWRLRRQSPPEFLLQPHDLYPMSQGAFDYWVEILQAHFPEHPALARLGATFVPRLPEEVETQRAANTRAHPVAEMKDQDGERRTDPALKDVIEWAEMMKPGDALLLRRRDGGLLRLTLGQSAHSAVCLDAAGAVQAEATGMQSQAVHQLSRQYLNGDVDGCVRQLRNAKR